MTRRPTGRLVTRTRSFDRKEPELPDITIQLSLSQRDALRLAKRLARDDAFRGQVAHNPVETLADHGITITGDDLQFAPILPPKHVIEDALVNVVAASEFGSDDEFESPDPFAYWILFVLAAA